MRNVEAERGIDFKKYGILLWNAKFVWKMGTAELFIEIQMRIVKTARNAELRRALFTLKDIYGKNTNKGRKIQVTVMRANLSTNHRSIWRILSILWMLWRSVVKRWIQGHYVSIVSIWDKPLKRGYWWDAEIW